MGMIWFSLLLLIGVGDETLLGEFFHFFPDYIDSPLIWGIKLDDPIPIEGGAKYFFAHSQDSRGFPGPCRPVEQKMGNLTYNILTFPVLTMFLRAVVTSVW